MRGQSGDLLRMILPKASIDYSGALVILFTNNYFVLVTYTLSLLTQTTIVPITFLTTHNCNYEIT